MKKIITIILLGILFIIGCGKSQEEKNKEIVKQKIEQQKQRIGYLKEKYKAIDIGVSFHDFPYTIDYQKKLIGKNILIYSKCTDVFLKDSIKYVFYEPFSKVDYLSLWLKNVPVNEDYNNYVFVAKVDSVSTIYAPSIYASCIYFEEYYNSPKQEIDENLEDL